MVFSAHKRFIRELPMAVALAAAGRLATANIPFTLETKDATRSQMAYLSCHFEETLDSAIAQCGHGADVRLRVAIDPETPDER